MSNNSKSDAQSYKKLVTRLWRHINKRRRNQFGFLLILMLVSSFAEVLSIGSIMPFLAILADPDQVFRNSTLRPVIEIFGLTEPAELLLPITIVFCCSSLIAGFMRLSLLWASTRLSFATGADISTSIYVRTLHQPYSIHCARNSSEIINGISFKANGVIYNVIMPLMHLLSSAIIFTVIFFTLTTIEPIVSVASFIGFGLSYATIIILTRKKLLMDSQRIASESSRVIKSLQEGLGGIRDVLLDGSQSTFSDIYRNADIPLRKAQGNAFFIGSSPRYIMEAFGMILIATVAYTLVYQSEGIFQAIPFLGVLALSAQRLLPVLQQAYGSWIQICSSKVSLEDTLDLLDQEYPTQDTHKPIFLLPFKQSISLEGIRFRYTPKMTEVLSSINLIIPKGACIGFIGETGCGKSTLLDIIMGLLQPTEGRLKIDDQTITPANYRAWQLNISHVPQAIFLADSTITENIAFGVPKDKINHQRVLQAAQQAQIADSIETWAEKYNTLVGERGIRLSGGQRQRIGIARALYRNSDVIIFDEATSALDNDTENAVMQAINSLRTDLTLMIITHRLTTLKNCTKIVELAHGGIKRIGSYQDFMKVAERYS